MKVIERGSSTDAMWRIVQLADSSLRLHKKGFRGRRWTEVAGARAGRPVANAVRALKKGTGATWD